MEPLRSVRNLVVGILRVTLVLTFLVACGLMIDFLLAVPRVATVSLALPGTLLLGLGMVLEGLAIRALWKFGLGTPHPIEPPRNLVTTGPYRISRNPLYVARLLILSGAAALLASPGLAVLTGCLFAFLQFVLIPREERRLVERHGSIYEEYRARVPKWIPLRSLVGRNK